MKYLYKKKQLLVRVKNKISNRKFTKQKMPNIEKERKCTEYEIFIKY